VVVVEAGDRIEEIQAMDEIRVEVVLEEIVLSILRRDTSSESSPERLRRSRPTDRESVLNEAAPIAQITLRG
jgi:hypothetical protein